MSKCAVASAIVFMVDNENVIEEEWKRRPHFLAILGFGWLSNIAMFGISGELFF